MGFGTFRRRHKILFGLFLVVFIATGIVIFFKDLFRIEHIEVVGEDIAIDIDTSKFERNLLFFPTDKLEDELLAKYPLLKAVHITKKLPQTLKISLTKRIPFAVIESEGQTMTISRDGVVLGDSDTEGSFVPIRISAGPLAIGQPLKDVRVGAALTFLEIIAPTLLIALIAENPDRSMQAYGQETNILFPQDDSIATRAATLQRLITGFRIKGKLPTTIDLRFDKPVIKN